MNSVNDGVKQEELLDAINSGAIDDATPRPLNAEEQDALVERCKTDAGAPFEAETLERLKATKRVDLPAFMRLLDRLKDAKKVSITDLRKHLGGGDEVAADGGQGKAVTFPEVEPWPEPVDGAALLDELAATFQRYVVMSPMAIHACALWTIFAHIYTCFWHSPRLRLHSPVRECGKTRVLEILDMLVARPLRSDNATAAVIFRLVDKYAPSLLLDESDTFVRDNDELRGMINSGHVRGGQVLRCVGEDFEPKPFNTWCPMAIAGIGELADTIESRCIRIPLQRRLRSEPIALFRPDKLATRQELGVLARKTVRWARDNEARMVDADPDLPETLGDRAQDNWRPLVAIADAAGGDWSWKARDAALALSSVKDVGDMGAGGKLLADLRALFDGGYDDALNSGFGTRTELEPGRIKGQPGFERLSSDALARALAALTDRPWATWTKGRPITTHRIAELLKAFDIFPRTIRWGGKFPHGYLRVQFDAAFGRYLDIAPTPESPKSETEHTLSPGNSGFRVPTSTQYCKNNDLSAKQSAHKEGPVGTLKVTQPVESYGMCGRGQSETARPREESVPDGESGPNMLRQEQGRGGAPGVRVSTVDRLRGAPARRVVDAIIGDEETTAPPTSPGAADTPPSPGNGHGAGRVKTIATGRRRKKETPAPPGRTKPMPVNGHDVMKTVDETVAELLAKSRAKEAAEQAEREGRD
jgi:hypothetical protein